jgi:hypothetical protein
MITVVSGRPKEGKSTLTATLAAEVSKRREAVIFDNDEDNVAELVRPRLEAAGAKLSRVYVPDDPFILPGDVALLEKRVKELAAGMAGPGLIILDPALAHLSVAASSGQAVRRALSPLKAMLERTGAACIIIDHLIKRPSRTANPLEALAGAGSGLPAAARAVYAFGRNPNDPNERILAPVGVNVMETPKSFAYEMEGGSVKLKTGKEVEVGRLIYVGDSDVDASQVIAYNGGGKAAGEVGGTKGAICMEWLIGMLMFGPREAADLKNEGAKCGFGWRTIQRSGDAIPIVRKREGFGKGSKVIWSLPAKHPALKVAKKMGGKPAGAS